MRESIIHIIRPNYVIHEVPGNLTYNPLILTAEIIIKTKILGRIIRSNTFHMN